MRMRADRRLPSLMSKESRSSKFPSKRNPRGSSLLLCSDFGSAIIRLSILFPFGGLDRQDPISMRPYRSPSLRLSHTDDPSRRTLSEAAAFSRSAQTADRPDPNHLAGRTSVAGIFRIH